MKSGFSSASENLEVHIFTEWKAEEVRGAPPPPFIWERLK